jgi:hypothetical protein
MEVLDQMIWPYFTIAGQHHCKSNIDVLFKLLAAAEKHNA